MSDSNSRLVYSTETGRIDEAKPAPALCGSSARPAAARAKASV